MNQLETERSPSRSDAKGFVPQVGREKAKDVFAVTIAREPREVYEFWRDLKNLSLFMKDIERIEVSSPLRSHWYLKTKAGLKFDWEAEIVGEIPGQYLAWESDKKARLQTAGAVSFESAPGGRGTVVRMSLSYKIPGGKAAEMAALFTGEDPRHLTLTNLRRMKAFLEAGEIPTTDGQPSGREKQSEIHEYKH
ncbi:MAG TPA: SRPBCC family protein [Pseudobdellovibrionaceae bacterium]|nr:SRPBCC family protein [Pseudobdellovibrionaceae bacterium]